ncbi:MAG TPA: hypothetical protein VFX59_21820 [Polyangiales bacterium]|nr:hypothetical protein [Polyangiales bacterium]
MERFDPGGPGLVERSVMLARADVAFLRYVLEAHEGLVFMHVEERGSSAREHFADGSGVVRLFATESLAGELDALVADLEAEGLVTLVR